MHLTVSLNTPNKYVIFKNYVATEEKIIVVIDYADLINKKMQKDKGNPHNK